MSAAGLAACGDLSEERGRTNVILISLDTCRADRLSCYGAARPTPHLDRLARESALFEDCLAQSSLTAPSHQSLFTGQYVHRHGLRTNHQPSIPRTTLASELKRHGWRTAAFTGHGSLQAKLGHGVGFDTFVSWHGEERPPYSRNLDAVLPEALTWLDANQDAPFFLFVHGYDPHCPYAPPEEWRSRYASWYEGDYDSGDRCGPGAFHKEIRQGIIGPDELELFNDLYDAEVAAADELIGSFLDELRHRGLFEDSIVVFTSDHGESLGQHEWIGHGQLWNDLLHVPLLIRFPAGQQAGRYPFEAQLIDVFPTILASLGISVPEGVQGVDWTPVLEQRRALPRGRMRLARAGDAVAVHFDARWKATFREDALGIRSEILYDLAQDPGETDTDLLTTAFGAERLRQLMPRYVSWRNETRADDAAYGGRPVDAELDPATEAMLQALGYAGEDESD